MRQKSLMVLSQARERIDRFIPLGDAHNLVLIHEASDALSFLRRIPVDVILLRDQMSEMDALEFLMNLQDLRLPTYAIVLYDHELPMGGKSLPEMTNVSFLKEPISPDDLNQIIIRRLEASPGLAGKNEEAF
ncbi:MAG TPA: hypothetical protein VI382_02630 [Candidatus Manganitrophaceae bacterium]|nr:hypothetical protein [Candidatus Manganitrophaceae bacterium]